MVDIVKFAACVLVYFLIVYMTAIRRGGQRLLPWIFLILVQALSVLYYKDMLNWVSKLSFMEQASKFGCHAITVGILAVINLLMIFLVNSALFQKRTVVKKEFYEVNVNDIPVNDMHIIKQTSEHSRKRTPQSLSASKRKNNVHENVNNQDNNIVNKAVDEWHSDKWHSVNQTAVSEQADTTAEDTAAEDTAAKEEKSSEAALPAEQFEIDDADMVQLHIQEPGTGSFNDSFPDDQAQILMTEITLTDDTEDEPDEMDMDDEKIIKTIKELSKGGNNEEAEKYLRMVIYFSKNEAIVEQAQNMLTEIREQKK